MVAQEFCRIDAIPTLNGKETASVRLAGWLVELSRGAMAESPICFFEVCVSALILNMARNCASAARAFCFGDKAAVAAFVKGVAMSNPMFVGKAVLELGGPRRHASVGRVCRK